MMYHCRRKKLRVASVEIVRPQIVSFFLAIYQALHGAEDAPPSPHQCLVGESLCVLLHGVLPDTFCRKRKGIMLIKKIMQPFLLVCVGGAEEDTHDVSPTMIRVTCCDSRLCSSHPLAYTVGGHVRRAAAVFHDRF